VTLTVEIAGLELFGRHGLLEAERIRGQRFLVDLRLETAEDAARSDRIEDAVDYRAVAAAVAELFGARRYQLIEALATEIADGLLERFPVDSVRLRVRKPDVVLGAPVEHAAVEVIRRRAAS
jgi:dihydroneopterin aldolase